MPILRLLIARVHEQESVPLAIGSTPHHADAANHACRVDILGAIEAPDAVSLGYGPSVVQFLVAVEVGKRAAAIAFGAADHLHRRL